ncbi:hypothetical protein BC831DRAFT_454807 [Entophlyctis helioformis]|nr:hypothetical protein BC831DRAFT_454807 [Entophlyctis helioformis]
MTNSKQISFTVVDAFTKSRFAGNPAAIVVIDQFYDDATLGKIAREFNLAETSFVVPLTPTSTHDFRLRWFTPTVEVELCGHATLAASHALFSKMTADQRTARPLRFQTLSGELVVACRDADPANMTTTLEMTFPAAPAAPADIDRVEMAAALGIAPERILSTNRTKFDIIVEIDGVVPIQAIEPDQSLVVRFDTRIVIVTTAADAESRNADFQSRAFAPRCGIPEDPVCGSAHCGLAPFWEAKLGKNALRAHQASARSGDMHLTYLADKGTVQIVGDAVTVSHGTMFI